MDYAYYIFPDTITTAKGDLESGERIIAFPTTHPLMPFSDGEGPFFSLETLKKESKIYAELKKSNPRRAHKIVQSKYINITERYLFVPQGTTYDMKLMSVWQHIVRGEEKGNGVSGIHFYDRKFVKIIEVLKKNDKGVLLAKVAAKFEEEKEWVIRNEPTTLFPTTWPIQQIPIELDFAFKNKVKEEGSNNRYEGISYSGIKIRFIIGETGMVKTAYPLL